MKGKWHEYSKEITEDVRFLAEGTNGSFTLRESVNPRFGREPLLRFDAEGYLPENISLPEKLERDLDLVVTMEPANDIEALVLTPEGTPAAGGQVTLVGKGLYPWLEKPARFFSADASQVHATVTREDGTFRLAARREGRRLLVAHERGWADVSSASVVGDPIHLRAWGRLEGVLRRGQSPAVNESVYMSAERSEADTIPFNFNVKTDASGRFQFDKVPPGRAHVGRYLLTPFSRNGAGLGAHAQEQSIEINAGGTTHVKLGGTGVSVKGRLVLEPARDDVVFELYPQNLRPAHVKSEPAKAPVGFGFFCQPDGSFVIEDVPPGSYVLELHIQGVKDRNNPDSVFRGFPVGERKAEIAVPDNQQREFNLGDIVVSARGLASP